MSNYISNTMAFPSIRPPLSPVYPSSYFLFKTSITSFRKTLLKSRKNLLPLLKSRKNLLPLLSSPLYFTSEQAVLEAVAESDSNTLPAVRSYENDLARLTVVGAVDLQQALTAAAADGGEAADEHILSGTATMVVETIFPGPVDDKSTISTRLISALLTLSSSDKRVISVISEVICIAALENTERNFLHDSTNRASYKFLPWFNKHKQISSRDSSAVLHNLLDHEILKNAKILLDKFNLERAKHKLKERKLKNSCWRSPAFSKLEKIGGPEFCDWISECIPSYLLRIDASRFNDVKFEGWKISKAASWELVLTYSQLVSLADTLDMYYEDVFTLPNERLACSAVSKSSNLELNKGSSMLMKFLVALASGIFLAAISVVVKANLPRLPSRNSYFLESSTPHSTYVSLVPHYSAESSKAEACCVSVVSRIKNYYGWPGEINKMNHGHGACVGELPTCLRKVDGIETNIHDKSSTSTLAESGGEDMKALQDIASYQVVLSTEENILGFQPTNRVAVNNWAANPLAKELYSGKNLSPGFFEPALEISCPRDVVVLELLMSVNPESNFALARTVDISKNINTR